MLSFVLISKPMCLLPLVCVLFSSCSRRWSGGHVHAICPCTETASHQDPQSQSCRRDHTGSMEETSTEDWQTTSLADVKKAETVIKEDDHKEWGGEETPIKTLSPNMYQDFHKFSVSMSSCLLMKMLNSYEKHDMLVWSLPCVLVTRSELWQLSVYYRPIVDVSKSFWTYTAILFC